MIRTYASFCFGGRARRTLLFLVATIALGACTDPAPTTQMDSGVRSDGAVGDAQRGDGAEDSGAGADGAMDGGGARPLLLISEEPSFDFGTIEVGATSEHTFTLTHTGSGIAAANIELMEALAAPFAIFGGVFPGTGGTCTRVLTPGASCTFVVSFSPTSVGEAISSVHVRYDLLGAQQTTSRGLRGMAVSEATLSISDGPTYNFGDLVVGRSSEHTFMISNEGYVDATSFGAVAGTLGAPFAYKGGAFPGTGGSCTPLLAARTSCMIVVTFTPSATGTFNDTIELVHTTGGMSHPLTVGVTGRAVRGAELVFVEPAAYDYGSVVIGARRDATITLRNDGDLPAMEVGASSGALGAPFTFKDGNYPGAGGTCAAVLAPGATCTVVVTFTPVGVAALHSDVIEISYMNDGVGETALRGVSGRGVTAASLAFIDTSPYDYGDIAIGGSASYRLRLRNTGGTAATLLQPSSGTLGGAFAFTGSGYPGALGTCGASLNAGATCEIEVRFTPTTTGLQTRVISVDYNDGLVARSATHNLRGTGVADARLEINGGVVFDYESVDLGSTNIRVITVRNVGSRTATAIVPRVSAFTGPFAYPAGGYPGASSGGTCGSSLAAGAECFIAVRFSPTSAGTFTSPIELGYTASLGAQIAMGSLRGTARTAAQLRIEPSPTLDFGTIGLNVTVEQTLTVFNDGGTRATSIASRAGFPASPFAFKGGTFPGTGGTCTSPNLNGGASCTMVVTFRPTIVGTYNSSVSLDYYTGAATANAARALSGSGVTGPALSIAPETSASFGNVVPTGTPTVRRFIVSNTGTAPATAISPVSGSPALPFAYTGSGYPGNVSMNPCGSTLAGGATCYLELRFAPTTIDSFAEVLSLNYHNGAGMVTATRVVTGNGVSAASIGTTDSGAFADTVVGSSRTRSFLFRNSGGATATGLSWSIPVGSSSYSFDGAIGGDCGATLAPAATCTVDIEFNPASAASIPGTLRVNYDDGLVARNTSVALTGRGVNAASLSIAQTTLPEGFGVVLIGATLVKSYTVSNSGDVAATGLTPTTGAPGAPFTYSGGGYPGTPGGTCTTTLPAGGSCVLNIAYTPTTSGNHTGQIDLSYQDGAAPRHALHSLSGVGRTAADLRYTVAGDFAFATTVVGTTRQQVFTLRNHGETTADALQLGTALHAAFSIPAGTFTSSPPPGACTATLAPNATCTVTVSFAPSSAGSFATVLDVDYTSGLGAAEARKNLSANAIGAATLTLTANPAGDWAFGGVVQGGPATVREFTLRNTAPAGSADATSLTNLSVPTVPFSFVGGTYPGTGGTCAGVTTLAPGASCTIRVQAQAGAMTMPLSYEHTLTVRYYNGVTSPSATLLLAVAVLTPASLTYTDGTGGSIGNVLVGSTAARLMTIRNGGGATATGIGAGALFAPFGFYGGSFPGVGGGSLCTTTLAPNTSCNMMLAFNPASSGYQSTTLRINYNNGAATTFVNRNISGTGYTPAVLRIGDGSELLDLGTYPSGEKVTLEPEMFNVGGLTAERIEIVSEYPEAPLTISEYPSGSCTDVLDPEASCTHKIALDTSVAGTFETDLRFTYIDGVEEQIVIQRVTVTVE